MSWGRTVHPVIANLVFNEIPKHPAKIGQSEGIQSFADDVTLSPRDNLNKSSGPSPFTSTRPESSPSPCMVKWCQERTVRDKLSSHGGKVVWSFYCQEHTCQAPRQKDKGFCLIYRNPGKRYCHTHGRCTGRDCTKEAVRGEDIPYPYRCAEHSSGGRRGRNGGREGKGGSGTGTPTSQSSTRPGSSSLSFAESIRSGELSVYSDQIPSFGIFQVILASCSYVAQSRKELSFSRGELFYVTDMKEGVDWYEGYSHSLPEVRGFVPVSYFEVLLQGKITGDGQPSEVLQLYWAIITKNFAFAHRLLHEHPELANDTHQNLTPLQFAAGTASADFVLLLIVKGADVDSVSKSRKSPIDWALDRSDRRTVITLRAFGANSADQRYHQRTNSSNLTQEEMDRSLANWPPENTLVPENGTYREDLHPLTADGQHFDFVAIIRSASKKGKLNIVEYVLQLFQESPFLTEWLNKSVDFKGWTALHHAASTGQSAVVKRLIDGGARTEVRTAVHKLTPLLIAATYGQQSSVKTLLECDANIFARTHAEETAVQLAKEAGHHKALNVLLQYHRQVSAIFKEFESVMSHDSEGEQPNRSMSNSGPADIHRTLTESPDAGGENEILSQQPGSTKQPQEDTDPKKGPPSSCIDVCGVFDGYNFPLPVAGQVSSIGRSKAFDRLILTLQSPDNFQFKEDDETVKIAILDTGIDLTHRDWQQARIVRFEEDGKPVHQQKEPSQWTRIKDFKNFCNPERPETERDVMDLDGHGTQVAGILLRLAPRAEIYVARVCEGDSKRGISATGPETTETLRGIRPKAIADAVDWAIEQRVHLINMSCGFLSSHQDVEDALERAKNARIVTFTAMCNAGNNLQRVAAWPARKPSLTIGIHSCRDDLGMDRSSFTPPAVRNSDNFMAVGEGIITHWPEFKGGKFRIAGGTSFATPVATAMAALVLAFVFQKKCKKQREDVELKFGGKNLILKTENMAALLHQISKKAGDYRYIHPSLLWEDFNARVKGVEDTPDERMKHAWEIIRRALDY